MFFLKVKFDALEQKFDLILTLGEQKIRLSLNVPKDYPKKPPFCILESDGFEEVNWSSLWSKLIKFSKGTYRNDQYYGKEEKCYFETDYWIYY